MTPTEQAQLDAEHCKFCPNNRTWHREHKPRHLFTSPEDPRPINDRIRPPAENPASLEEPATNQPATNQPTPPVGDHNTGGNIPSTTPSSAKQVIANMPTDPVLRTALIDLGIITPADLHAAQEKILATSNNFQAFVDAQRPDSAVNTGQEPLQSVVFGLGTAGPVGTDPPDRTESTAERGVRADNPRAKPNRDRAAQRRRHPSSTDT